MASRVALAVGIFGLMVSVVAVGFGYWALSRQLDARLGSELEGKRALLLHVLSEISAVEQIPENSHRFEDLLIGHQDLHLAVVDPRNGKVLSTSSAIARESMTKVSTASGQATVGWQGSDGARYESVWGDGPAEDGRLARYVVSMNLKDDRALLTGYLGATLLGVPALLALVAFGAWAVARTGLAPLKRFTVVTSLVTTRNLAQRIDVVGLPTELKALAEGFNTMLDRIDEGVNRLSEFSADLAHEMRTPVATLLGRTQVALSKKRSAEELHDVLAGNVEELDRLTRLIADMLFLARADQGNATLTRSSVDLALEASRVAEFLSVIAEERGVNVEIKGHATVQADQILVQRAVTNLLTNAIRHADSKSDVSIAIRREKGCIRVDVSNRGPGIPADHQGRVFERFVRLDAARTRSDGAGTGLGLAIVRSVMQAHGGSVQVASELGGVTTFSLRFPTGRPS